MPNTDIGIAASQIRYETVYSDRYISTCFSPPASLNREREKIYDWVKFYAPATNISLESSRDKVSTWDDYEFDEYDIIPKVEFSNKQKILAKITKISKYTPIIVID